METRVGRVQEARLFSTALLIEAGGVCRGQRRISTQNKRLSWDSHTVTAKVNQSFKAGWGGGGHQGLHRSQITMSPNPHLPLPHTHTQTHTHTRTHVHTHTHNHPHYFPPHLFLPIHQADRARRINHATEKHHCFYL